MRSTTTTNYSIQYPNATHYAFNPALIVVRALVSTAKSVTISLIGYTDDGERTFTETRELYNGEAAFNISRFLQVLFDGIDRYNVPHETDTIVATDLVRRVTVSGVINNSDNTATTLPTFRIDAIWGALARGESTGGILRRKWFVNYPFTIDISTQAGDSTDVTVDGNPSKGVSFWNHDESLLEWATSYVHALIDVASFIDPRTVDKTVHITFPHGIVVKNDVETVGLTAYHLTIDRTSGDSDKHIYLRWIDNQGRFCYHLFKRTGTTTAVSGSSWQHDNGDVPSAYIDGAAIETHTRQALAAQKAVTIGEKLADEEMFDFLLTCAKSPVIDVFDGYSDDGLPLWHRVNVVAGNYAKTTKTHQDFTMTINEPAQTLQSL